MNRKFTVDLGKLCEHDLTMLYEIITDYVTEFELPSDVDHTTWRMDYEIEVTLGEEG